MTERDIWVAAYLAAISAGLYPYVDLIEVADQAVRDYRVTWGPWVDE